MSPGDVAFVIAWQDEWFADYRMIDGAKGPNARLDSLGVPVAMWDGQPNRDGWVQWKFAPPALTEPVLAEFERTLPGAFPPLFRAYATARAVMRAEVAGVRMPGFPTDVPLRDLRWVIGANELLVAAWYVPIGWDTNDQGPVCFDMRRRAPDGDCPMVGFDHDRDWSGGRDGLEKIARALFGSFREYLCFAREDARSFYAKQR